MTLRSSKRICPRNNRCPGDGFNIGQKGDFCLSQIPICSARATCAPIRLSRCTECIKRLPKANFRNRREARNLRVSAGHALMRKHIALKHGWGSNMMHPVRLCARLSACVIALTAWAGTSAAQDDAVVPKPEDLPNPYRLVEGWPTLPASMQGPHGHKWGEVIRVHLAPDGNIWVFQR